VNLLEKRLSAVCFEDVRLPWVNLYKQNQKAFKFILTPAGSVSLVGEAGRLLRPATQRLYEAARNF